VIIFIGRKTREKGVLNLIEAVKALQKEIPVKLFLIGPSIDWYHDLYAQLSEQEKKYIIDLGVLPHNEKVNLLHISDLLVLPSQYEAFGIVFLEAWICGKPVIGTAEGAMPSVIGNDGYICRFGNTEDLKSKIAEALSKPDDLKIKGIKGREKVLQNYTWDIIGMKAERAISAVYES
jgi:glycosyltransferase involved in cell wall biosynthesis